MIPLLFSDPSTSTMISDSIRQIWDWLMIALGAAFVIPNVLRWYWWRLNGWGYSAGTIAGLVGAVPILLLTLFWQIEPPLYVTFPVLCSVSLVATLAGTWLTRPTEKQVLKAFYKSVRPFGFWAPIRDRCDLPTTDFTSCYLLVSPPRILPHTRGGVR